MCKNREISSKLASLPKKRKPPLTNHHFPKPKYFIFAHNDTFLRVIEEL